MRKTKQKKNHHTTALLFNFSSRHSYWGLLCSVCVTTALDATLGHGCLILSKQFPSLERYCLLKNEQWSCFAFALRITSGGRWTVPLVGELRRAQALLLLAFCARSKCLNNFCRFGQSFVTWGIASEYKEQEPLCSGLKSKESWHFSRSKTIISLLLAPCC